MPVAPLAAAVAMVVASSPVALPQAAPASGGVVRPAAVTAPADAPANPHAAAAAAAARWLAGQTVDGRLPGPFGGVDWGLTVDALLALQASGTEPAAVRSVADALAANVDSYATGADFGEPDYVIGGAVAKLLVAALAAGRDPTDFGGHDLRRRTLHTIAGPDAGGEHGWVYTFYAGERLSGGNLFDQSLAVIGLARSGGVPQPVVDFLVRQQCTGGGFRLYPTSGGAACTAVPVDQQLPDVDSTAMAVQALLLADEAGVEGAAAAARAGVAWLLDRQRPDGSFTGSAVTDYPNSNSTGLAGQALAAAGETAAADRAAAYLASLQLTDTGAAARHAGAVAYTPQAFAAAVASGISDGDLDQWRRSTAQAALGLAKVPLGVIGTPGGQPGPEPTPTASSTASPGPTGSPSPTVSPTASGPADPTAPPSAAPSPSATDPATATPPASSPSSTPSPGGGSGGGLPTTGVAVASIGLLGGGVVVAGVALVVLGRRRREPKR